MLQELPELSLQEPDFTDIFTHTLDSKGRFTVPSPYRDKNIETIYITQGFDGNLDVFPVPAFLRICAKVKQMNMADPMTRLFKRVYLSGASKVGLDSAGRILIPAHHREYAQITNEIVISGVDDHFELWSPENWKTQEQKIQEVKQNPETFIHLNL